MAIGKKSIGDFHAWERDLCVRPDWRWLRDSLSFLALLIMVTLWLSRSFDTAGEGERVIMLGLDVIRWWCLD